MSRFVIRFLFFRAYSLVGALRADARCTSVWSGGLRQAKPLRGVQALPGRFASAHFCQAVMLALLLALAPAGRAEDAVATGADTVAVPKGQPRWELGLTGLGACIPHYLGSDEYRTYAFPLPYGIYRGDHVQVDREGFRGLFYRGPILETDVSISGNPPVKADGGARRGMPDLDPLLEFGPAVRLVLFRGERLSALQIEGAVRGCAAMHIDDAHIRAVGTHANLGLAAASFTPHPGSPWRCGASTGVEFGDREYDRYFYDVTEEQALSDRPAYRSPSGYGGSYLSGFVVRRLSSAVSISLFTRWSHLDGAVYEDSPLVRTRDNVTIAAAIVWKLAESKTRVERRP